MAPSPGPSAIRKVITLIEAMKEQVDQDAADDLAAYERFACWCTTNDKAKAEAIAQAQARVEELGAVIEEASANSGALKTNVESLEREIAEDQEALAGATANREKESAAFQAENADAQETVGLLGEAVEVLSKVQLLQKGGDVPISEARVALAQVQEKIRTSPRSRFASVLQRDLFDMFGAMGDASPGLRGAASFEQPLPGKPNELQGAAAGAKSYDARSGGILGMISQMRDQFAADLAAAQKQDAESEASYQALKAAKQGEIGAATGQKVRKESELADTMDAKAKAEEDRESTGKAVEADQKFFANLKTDCATQDESYKARSKVRSDEQAALAETLTILTEDSARELYEKTGTFLQLKSTSRALLKERRRAMKKLARVAMKHKNFALMSLAARGGLDAFTEVKEAIDKMAAELQRQQKEEYEKREFCNKEIDRLEDEIKDGVIAQEDLGQKHQHLVNGLEALQRDIDTLKHEEEEMKMSLKQASENRKAESQLFQTAVMDQRATVNILHKAVKRLQSFYAPSGEAKLLQEPGQAVAPKPETPKAYGKSAGAGGVLQLLAKVIEEAEVEEKELTVGEQHAQDSYASFVQNAAKTIEAGQAAISEKSALVAEAASEKAETEAAQLSTDESLSQLNDLLKAHHLDCDWLLKYFSVREKARTEELDAIADAKAVLSGADFGKN